MKRNNLQNNINNFKAFDDASKQGRIEYIGHKGVEFEFRVPVVIDNTYYFNKYFIKKETRVIDLVKITRESGTVEYVDLNTGFIVSNIEENKFTNKLPGRLDCRQYIFLSSKNNVYISLYGFIIWCYSKFKETDDNKYTKMLELLKDKKAVVNHINGFVLDNTINNLEVVSNSENIIHYQFMSKLLKYGVTEEYIVHSKEDKEKRHIKFKHDRKLSYRQMCKIIDEVNNTFNVDATVGTINFNNKEIFNIINKYIGE